MHYGKTKYTPGLWLLFYLFIVYESNPKLRNRDLVLELDRKYNLERQNLKNNVYHTKSIFRSTFVCVTLFTCFRSPGHY